MCVCVCVPVCVSDNELRMEETARSTAVIAAQSALGVERINAQRTVDAMNGTAELARIESTLPLYRLHTRGRLLFPLHVLGVVFLWLLLKLALVVPHSDRESHLCHPCAQMRCCWRGSVHTRMLPSVRGPPRLPRVCVNWVCACVCVCARMCVCVCCLCTCPHLCVCVRV